MMNEVNELDGKEKKGWNRMEKKGWNGRNGLVKKGWDGKEKKEWNRIESKRTDW